MKSFRPAPFRSNWLIRGGHLQTILSVRSESANGLKPMAHRVDVSEGDQILLHEDTPESSNPESPCVLFIHGLSGCYCSPYMERLATRFLGRGYRVFRIDMRGCGAGAELADNLTHAGRSQDVLDALCHIAMMYPKSKLAAAGISLGGAQLLRAVGRIGAGLQEIPDWFSKLKKVAAVAPPIDLVRCSDHMQQRKLRLYNYYFIRSLLKRLPKRLWNNAEFRREMELPPPRTLRELDDRFTAPLSGFSDALDYYEQSSCNQVMNSIKVPTLVLASQDDPIVPVDCFPDPERSWSGSAQLLLTRSGGHAGYIGPKKKSWMDEVLEQWLIDHPA